MKPPAHKRCATLSIRTLRPDDHVALCVTGLDRHVEVGDSVEAGALVASSPSAARLHLCVHSPYVGRVRSFEARGPDSFIVIEGAPLSFHGEDSHRRPDEIEPETIIERVRRAGVVGMGGAMFPTYAKLIESRDIDTVLVNASESEPYVCCDGRTLAEHRARVECGMRMIQRAVGAEDARIVASRRGYPHGHEASVIEEFLGRSIPSGGRAADVNVVVCNVQTAVAVHEAACMGRPLLDRVITVDGDAIGKPGNYRVCIGTRVRHVLEACDADLDQASIVLAGGPMMGRRVGLEATIQPGTSAVLALDDSQHTHAEETPCIRCARCLEACPIDLPAGIIADDPDDRVADCIECGICQFVCVANRPLVDELRRAKRALAEDEGEQS